MLVKAGVNLNIQANDGRTAIYIAAHNGYLEVVKTLCEAGADINIKTKEGRTPLQAASFRRER